MYKLKQRTKRKVDLGSTCFATVRSYGTREVFLAVGWSGDVKALVTASPARMRKLAEAILVAVKREKS